MNSIKRHPNEIDLRPNVIDLRPGQALPDDNDDEDNLERKIKKAHRKKRQKILASDGNSSDASNKQYYERTGVINRRPKTHTDQRPNSIAITMRQQTIEKNLAPRAKSQIYVSRESQSTSMYSESVRPISSQSDATFSYRLSH